MISNSSLAHRTTLVCPVASCQLQLTHRRLRLELRRGPTPNVLCSRCWLLLLLLQCLQRSRELIRSPTNSLQQNTDVHDHTCESKQAPLSCYVFLNQRAAVHVTE